MLVACAALALARPVVAQPEGFAAAAEAWAQGDLESAHAHYQAALDKGGLEPADVVVAYARIGTVKAALRDTQGALSAFRVAAAIDPAFQLPEDSGPVAQKLYAQALMEAAQQGEALSLQLTAPDSLEHDQAFSVQTVIPEGFAVFVAKVVVTIEDPATGKKWKKSKNSEPSLDFEFPDRVAVKGAQLVVKAAAVDGQNNAWVVSKAIIKVSGTRQGFDWGEEEEERPAEGADAKKDDKDGGIFSGPVPWIVGGAVLLGGILLFAATSSSDTVTVGAPKWE